MTPATPASVPLGRRASTRAPLVAVFPAAVLAGAGLGLAALALVQPPALSPALPPVATTSPQAAADPVAANAATSPWPALFGDVPLAVVSEPDEPAPESPDLFSQSIDDGGLVLRGLALPDDPDEAFAIVEGDDGLHVVRIGSVIGDRFEVQSIEAEGMLVLNLDTDDLVDVLFPPDRFAEGGSEDGPGSMEDGFGEEAMSVDLGDEADSRAFEEEYRRRDARSEFSPSGDRVVPSFGISR